MLNPASQSSDHLLEASRSPSHTRALNACPVTSLPSEPRDCLPLLLMCLVQREAAKLGLSLLLCHSNYKAFELFVMMRNRDVIDYEL